MDALARRCSMLMAGFPFRGRWREPQLRRREVLRWHEVCRDLPRRTAGLDDGRRELVEDVRSVPGRAAAYWAEAPETASQRDSRGMGISSYRSRPEQEKIATVPGGQRSLPGAPLMRSVSVRTDNRDR
jgi:hypothetical protein